MTLIALLITEAGFPILIGDALLTWEIDSTRPVDLPTIGPVPQRPFGAKFVYGTAQKVVQVAPDCCIAWAGELELAKRFLREFGARADQSDYGRRFDESLRQADPSDTGRLELLCLWGRNSGGYRVRTNSPDAAPLPGLRHAFVGGSGAHRLLPLLQSHPLQANLHPVLSAHGLVGKFMCEEMVSGRTLTDHFGGTYEIAFPHDNIVKKLDSWTTLFLSANRDKAGCVAYRMLRVAKHCYVGNQLFEVSLHTTLGAEDGVGHLRSVGPCRIHVIGDPLSQRPDDEWIETQARSLQLGSALGGIFMICYDDGRWTGSCHDTVWTPGGTSELVRLEGNVEACQCTFDSARVVKRAEQYYSQSGRSS